MINIVAAKQVVETWNHNKMTGREFNQRDMRRFIEIMNDRTKGMIHWMEWKSPADAQYAANVFEDCISVIQGDPIYSDYSHQLARETIRIWNVNEADFYTGAMELAIHACTLLTPRAKVIAGGIDRTNV